MELRVHDLVRLTSPEAIVSGDAPDWVLASLRAAPWAVVRRAAPVAGLVPIGVRGSTRSERYATTAPAASIVERLSPEDVSHRSPPRKHPVVEALARLAPALDAEGFAWGPAGAAGYELATGRQALTDVSDLDLVLRLENLAETASLRRIAAAAERESVRVDILVEAPTGGVALAEFFGASDELMLRTPSGPRLVRRDELIGVASC